MIEDKSQHENDRGVSFLLPETICEIQRHSINNPNAGVNAIQKQKASRMLTATFCMMVIFIFAIICFSIWLSIEVGMKHRNIWSSNGQFKVNPPFELDDMFNSSLQPKAYSIEWLTDEDTYIYTHQDGSIMARDMTSDTHTVIVNYTLLNITQPSKYYISNDLRYALLAYNYKKQWRHSFTAKYKLYERQADDSQGTIMDFPNDQQLKNLPLQFARFAPTGHKMVFAFGNNLYLQDEPDSKPVKLTSSGKHNVIFNGVPDWLYEEEIISSETAVWWSKDSRYLAYAQFNCSEVPLVRLPYYGDTSNVFGSTVEFPYPKAGDLAANHNTKVKLYIADTDHLRRKHINISPPQQLNNKDHYIIGINWRDKQHVSVLWVNRPQNQSYMEMCSAHSGKCTHNHKELIVGGWISPWPYTKFINKGSSYLTILSKPEGETGDWPHVAMVSSPLEGTGSVRFLTSGQEEVRGIVGYHAHRHLVFYLSTGGDPRKNHLYQVGTPSAAEKDQKPRCLTCKVSSSCYYHSAQFSPSGKYYNLGCLGPGIPKYTLWEVGGKIDEVLENNTVAYEHISTRDMPRIEFHQFNIGGGYTAWARVTVPPAVDRDQDRVWYPVLVMVDGEPGSQSATHKYSIGYETFLASSKKVVVLALDGRGTSGRGDRFKFMLHRRLGTLEVEDQILASRHMTNSDVKNKIHDFSTLKFGPLYYGDKEKYAIMGRSYGGFVAAHAFANESSIYKCAISASALFDRKYHNTAYTERFMGYASSDDNEAGYNNTDILDKIDLFRDKKFLLVHGTADDNVHFSSSAQLIKALNDANIQFRSHIYPDQNHELYKNNRHLYDLYSDFLINHCWDLEKQTET